jgi:hypothetical protein
LKLFASGLANSRKMMYNLPVTCIVGSGYPQLAELFLGPELPLRAFFPNSATPLSSRLKPHLNSKNCFLQARSDLFQISGLILKKIKKLWLMKLPSDSLV